jgi:Ca-activated chloride channel family protein
MALAYKYGNPDRPLNVVILSDGMTEQAERSELLSLIQSRPPNAKVFCVGVGNEVNRHLLSQLAEDTGGLAAFVSGSDNFQRQAKAFRRKLMRPAASNVQIDFDGIDVYDREPGELPNLYHGMPVRLYGRYRGGGTVNVKVHADINGAPIDQTVTLDFPQTEPANPELERMWAWQRVDRLLKEADRGGSRSAVVGEIVRLGETYSIVTEYTSFIVLENDAEYKRWRIDRKNLLRMARDRKQHQVVRAELAALREKALADLGPRTSGPQLASADRLDPSQTSSMPVPGLSVSQPMPSPARPRSRDLQFAPIAPGSGGGGAFDPVTGAIAIGLAGLGFAAARKRRQPRS